MIRSLCELYGTVCNVREQANSGQHNLDRGQGLNNAILDAAYLCRALETHVRKDIPVVEALAIYEKEMQERGRSAVISSTENSLMVHDWEQLKQSPVFTMGMKPLQKT